MKTLSILPFLALAPALMAAPAIKPADLSEATLRGIATERQQKSIDDYNNARRRAVQEREDAIKEARKITEDNDKGMKKTIQRRALNTMLPPCEREHETPREPGGYIVRPEW